MLVNDRFELYLLGVEFEFAIAQSVFTHLPLNHIRRCLFELAKCVKQGGKSYATFFECSSESLYTLTTHQPGGIITYMDSAPYHYQLQDFFWLIKGLPWTLSYIVIGSIQEVKKCYVLLKCKQGLMKVKLPKRQNIFHSYIAYSHGSGVC